MIIHINNRYNEWARWTLTKRSAGLGYPRQVSFMRLTPSDPYRGAPLIDSDAWEIEQCVLRLDPQEQHLIKEFYLREAVPVEQIARDLSCSRDTVYARLHRVHDKTLGWLNDLYAGVSLPPVRMVRKVQRVRRL